MRVVLFPLGLLTGCLLISDERHRQRLDQDSDGVSWTEDCDGQDPTVGRYEDITVYIDGDGDGYGGAQSERELPACPSASDLTGLSLKGGDCDDADLDIHPNATELCDGVDNDCDDSTDVGDACRPETDISLTDKPSRDGSGTERVGLALAVLSDGTSSRLVVGAPGGDSLSTGSIYLVDLPISGQASLTAGDGIGRLATTQSAGAGQAIAAWTGDEGSVLLVGGPNADHETGQPEGTVWLLDGDPAGENLSTEARVILTGPSAGHLGSAMSGTVTDQGSLAVLGAPGASTTAWESGAAYICLTDDLTPLEGDAPVPLESADVGLITGAEAGERAGASLSATRDVDGDGVLDLALGSARGTGTATGRAWLFLGLDALAASRATTEDANVIYDGLGAGDGLGEAVTLVRDLQGDGYDDLVLAAPHMSQSAGGKGGDDSGQVYVITGGLALEGTGDVEQAWARYAGVTAGSLLGASVADAGDLDGDVDGPVDACTSGWCGLDLALGAPGEDASGTESGAVYLVYGPVESGVYLVDGPGISRVVGQTPGDHLGAALVAVGDQTGEGNDDLVIGAPDASNGGGALYLLAVGR